MIYTIKSLFKSQKIPHYLAPLQLSWVTESKNALLTIRRDIQNNVITVLKGLLENEGQQ
jgi:hypothetical protein